MLQKVTQSDPKSNSISQLRRRFAAPELLSRLGFLCYVCCVSGHFTGWGGLQIYHDSWPAEIDPRGAVIVLHGYAEHSGRYGHVIGYLNGQGYNVHAMDLRGHGRSEGLRGDVVRFTDFVRDLATFVDLVRKKETGLPLFLLAHSTGASVAAIYAAHHGAALGGVVLSGTYIRDAGTYDPFLTAIARILNFFVPFLPVQELDPNRQSRDPEVVAEFRKDALSYHGRVRVRMAVHFLNMPRYVEPMLPQVTCPALILHGGADELSLPDNSRVVYEGIASTDKTLRVFDGVRHEIYNEPEKDEVMAEVGAWLASRAPEH